MNRFKNSGGPGFKGLLLGSLMAGALGLALSQPSTYGTPAGNAGTQQTPSTQSEPSQTGQSGATMSAPTSAGQLPPNVTAGWKIRVCSEKTKADNINFTLSPGGKSAKPMGKSSKSTSSMSDKTATIEEPIAQGGAMDQPGATGETGTISQQTAMWSRGEPTEIAVPTELREVERLKIEAVPGQKDKGASVCLIYNDHVAKKLNFDDREVSTVKKTETGECGC